MLNPKYKSNYQINLKVSKYYFLISLKRVNILNIILNQHVKLTKNIQNYFFIIINFFLDK